MVQRAWMFGLGCAALAIVLATAVTVTGPAVPAEAPAIADAAGVSVVNRAWVQRMPRSTKDIVTWFIPMELRGKRFGVTQKSSHFWFAGERFTWTRQGSKLRMTYQQSGKTLSVGARAYACKKGGFDYCLDLTRGDRKATLYSKKNWTIPRRSADVPEVDTTPVQGACDTCVEGVPQVLEDLLGAP